MPKIIVKIKKKNGEYLELDDNYIQNISSTSQANNDHSTIFYGVMPNTGSLELIDVDGTIKNEILNGNIDNSNVEIDIYVGEKKIQHHVSTDSTYMNSNNTLNIQLSNELNKFSEITGINYYMQDSTESGTLTSLYKIFHDLIGYYLIFNYDRDKLEEIGGEKIIDDMMSNNVLLFNYNKDTVKNYLSTIDMNYAYTNEQSLRDIIENICEISQTVFIQDDNGDFKFYDTRPVITRADSQIKITKDKMFSDLEYDLFVKNKINSVSITENDVNYIYIDKNTTDIYVNKDNGNQIPSEIIIDKSSSNPNIEILNNGESREIRDGNRYYNYYTIKYEFPYENDIKIVYPKIKLLYSKNVFHGVEEKGDNYTNKFVSGERYTLVDEYDVQVINNLMPDSSVIDNYLTPTDKDDIENFVVKKYDDKIVVYGNILESNVLQGGYDYVSTISCSIKASMKEIDSKYEDNNEVADYYISDNELLRKYTLYNDKENQTSMSSILKQNIVNDYRNGLNICSIQIKCDDYLNTKGDKVVDWSKGEIISNNSFIYIEGYEYKYWKVVGRHFDYKGLPIVTLYLLECKLYRDI